MKLDILLVSGTMCVSGLFLSRALTAPVQTPNDTTKTTKQNRSSRSQYFYLSRPAGETSFLGEWDFYNRKELGEIETHENNDKALLLVRNEGVTYQITDAVVIDDLSVALAPVREMGRKMGVLGKEIGEVGVRQGKGGGLRQSLRGWQSQTSRQLVVQGT